MGRQKGMYWLPEHEQAVLQWLSANTRQEFVIYKFLKPRVMQMQEIILHRYFNCPPARYLELMHDCSNHVFLNLRSFNPERGTKAYSFVQTLIKNYCMDKLVTSRILKKSDMNKLENHIEIDSQEFREEGLEEVLIVPDYSYSEVDVSELRQQAIQKLQKDLDSVRMKINRLKFSIKKEYGFGKKYRRVWVGRSSHVTKEREYLKLCIKFFRTFESPGITIITLNEYILSHSITLTPTTTAVLSGKFIGNYSGFPKIFARENKNVNVKEISLTEEKYPKLSYLLDDNTPNETHLEILKRRKRYDDVKDYYYF